MRRTRPRYWELRPDQRRRCNARSYAKVYLKRGKLVKPKRCERCERARRLQMHHHDYDKPLEVEFLCRPCHQEHHAKLAREKRSQAA